MTERLTARTLDRMASTSEEWREATCSNCGRRVEVIASVRTLACDCPDGICLDVRKPKFPLEITHTATGPTVRERLIAEVRRLRGIIAGMQGCVAYHTHCHTSEDPEDHLEPWQICGTDALDAEARAIREEQG